MTSAPLGADGVQQPGTASLDDDLTERVLDALRNAGLAKVGVADASPFDNTRVDLETRKGQGLNGDMQFTYRKPDRSTNPRRTVDNARSLVVGALDYFDGSADPAAEGAHGRVARYARHDTYGALTAKLRVGAKVLKRAGFRAVVLADQNNLVDREAARRAGIGFYGHNANLLLPGQGSWFVLGSIVTDAPLRPNRPGGRGCGPCRKCIDACPTRAIVAPGVVDARRCLSWLLQSPEPFPFEYRTALGDRMYGCDDCQEVCPPNRARRRRGQAAGAIVDLEPFLAADDATVMEAAGRWYVTDRNPRYLRRNALLVLANTAPCDDPGALGHVRDALADPDPLVRGHAVWAAARLGHPELADSLAATEADPMVREELARRDEVAARA